MYKILHMPYVRNGIALVGIESLYQRKTCERSMLGEKCIRFFCLIFFASSLSLSLDSPVCQRRSRAIISIQREKRATCAKIRIYRQAHTRVWIQKMIPYVYSASFFSFFSSSIYRFIGGISFNLRAKCWDFFVRQYRWSGCIFRNTKLSYGWIPGEQWQRNDQLQSEKDGIDG